MIVKKIDMHMHCSDIDEFPKGPIHHADPREVRAMYDRLGVEKGVLMSGGAIPECAINSMSTRETRAMVDKNQDTIGWWFVSVDPRNIANSPDADFTPLLKHYRSQGASGISELSANMPLDDPKMLNLFKHAQDIGFPVTLHFGLEGKGYGVIDDLHLPRLEHVLALFPDLVILGHSMAFWTEIGDDVTEENRFDYLTAPFKNPGRLEKLMREHKNLYADLSAMSAYSALMRNKSYTYSFFETFQDQIVYATDIATNNWIDLPQANLSSFLDDAVGTGKISQACYEKICRLNALRLLEVKK
jgi:predicted TIM-barrel fold metal-dependent hydrolase